MKVLFDTNIVLDILLDRAPFADSASYLFSKVERAEITGFLCATTITTIHYLITKALNDKKAVEHIHSLLSLFEIAPVNRVVIGHALELKFTDFEDAVLHEAARHAGAQYIVTRDISGFAKSNIPAYTSMELVNMLESLRDEG